MNEQQAGNALLNALRTTLNETVADKINRGYSPIDAVMKDCLHDMTKECIEANGDGLKAMLTNAVFSAVNDPAFVDEIRSAVRQKLARVLVQRFGGEVERQVNILKAHPATRDRIRAAIDYIIANPGEPK